jgi:hypothetical protein
MTNLLKKEMELATDNPGKQVTLKEQINRLLEQNAHFKKYASAFKFHQNAIETLKNNIFDDDLIEKALEDLNKIWHKVPITKSFFIT